MEEAGLKPEHPTKSPSLVAFEQNWKTTRLQELDRVTVETIDGTEIVSITVKQGDKRQLGADGKLTERAELTLAETPLAAIVEWSFAISSPPQDGTRTVIAQIKDTSEYGKERNPVFALRLFRFDESMTLGVSYSGSETAGNVHLQRSKPFAPNDWQKVKVKYSFFEGGMRCAVYMNDQLLVELDEAQQKMVGYENGTKTPMFKIGVYRDDSCLPQTIMLRDFHLTPSSHTPLLPTPLSQSV